MAPLPPVRAGRRTSAGSDELTRLGLDIHDGPLQLLAGVAGGLYALSLDEQLPPPAHERLDELIGELTAAVEDLRDIATPAARPRVAAGPLTEALRRTAGRYVRLQPFGSLLELDLDLDPALDRARLEETARAAVLHLLESALANALQHADAARVAVRAGLSGPWVRLEVVDDGRGFDAAAELRRAERDGRLGFVGMRERVEAAGGALTLDTAPGRGTRVVGLVPAGLP